MKLISHRGNLNGPVSYEENDINIILTTLEKYTFDIEIDLWYTNNSYYLGHDKPQYKLEYGLSNDLFIKYHNRLWVHCKSIETLENLNSNNSYLNYFYHTNEDVVLTSKGNLWCYPGVNIKTKKSVILKFDDMYIEDYINESNGCGYICTDYPLRFATYLNNK